MTIRTIAAALAAGVVLLGCGTMSPKQTPRSLAAASWVQCNTGGGRCDVRVTRDPNGPYSCALGRFRVEPDFLELTGGRPVNIQWELPDQFTFCDGDGIDLKPDWASASRQVFEPYGSDRKDGARSGFEAKAACRPFRNWRWGNTTPGGEYAYEIRFRNKDTGQGCTIDPWLRNR